jgi:hypothetical protein
MKRLTWIVATAAAVVLVLAGSASARLGIAPLSVQDDAIIQVKHGHGHGHHRGWHRGRGHHYGWYRGRGHRHHRHWW